MLRPLLYFNSRHTDHEGHARTTKSSKRCKNHRTWGARANH